MTDEIRSPGKTTIAPEVLQNIAELTTLSVEGVSRLNAQVGRVGKLLPGFHRRGGVSIEITGEKVNIELHVVLLNDVNIRKVSREIQNEVGRAISEMVGMEIRQIDVNIEDIDFLE